MIEALTGFFATYGVTILVAVVACICVGCLVEIFKQSLFSKMEKKHEGDADKIAKVKTVKAGTAYALAAFLTAFFLACLWKSDLPKIGSVATLPIWYTAMFLLQMICDIKGVKAVFGRILGNVVKSTEEKPKKKKMKKVVTWTEVDD